MPKGNCRVVPDLVFGLYHAVSAVQIRVELTWELCGYGLLSDHFVSTKTRAVKPDLSRRARSWRAASSPAVCTAADWSVAFLRPTFTKEMGISSGIAEDDNPAIVQSERVQRPGCLIVVSPRSR